MKLNRKRLGALLILSYFCLTFPRFKPKKVDVSQKVILDKDINEENPELKRATLKLKMWKINSEQKIYNQETYGPLEINSIVILIQVHNRIGYLKHLINSLSKVKGISKTLLIFSHDYYNKEINELVQSIKFAKCMQIFFPFGLQLYPFEFPGDDMLDCPHWKPLNVEPKCVSSYDSFGNIRKAKITQLKHHWWWNWDVVFNKLRVTKNHTGLVVYLEEDHYVLEDFLHVLNVMVKLRLNVNVYTLSKKWPSAFYNSPTNHYFIGKWEMGTIAMNSTVWNKIKNCSRSFCEYDDYNWDWTLVAAVSTCYPLTTVNLKFPRVYHIGLSGIHGINSNDKLPKILHQITKFVRQNQRYLFPKILRPTMDALNLKKIKQYGGWADKRDHELCMQMAN